MEVLDQSGKVVAVANKVMMAGIGGPKARASWKSGEIWQQEWAMPTSGPLPPYSLTVDYVRFANQPGAPAVPDWGTDKSGMSRDIVSFTSAYRAERARLRQVLASEGLEGLKQDLMGDAPPVQ
jgi:hypothetical protein